MQPREGFSANDKRADAGRVAEHLVEGQRHEVRLDRRQVESVGRCERGAVHEHVPTSLVGLVDPRKRVVHAAEVGLGGKCEETRLLCVDPREFLADHRAVQAQVGIAHGQVCDRRAGRARELTDAVDRVVVVVGQQEAAAFMERVGLPDELERPTRVGREDDVVLGRIRREEHQDRCSRPFDRFGRSA